MVLYTFAFQVIKNFLRAFEIKFRCSTTLEPKLLQGFVLAGYFCAFRVQKISSTIFFGCKDELMITSKSITPNTNSSSVMTSTFHVPGATLLL